MHLRPQRWQALRLEPRVVPQPPSVAPRGMRQGPVRGSELLPALHRLGEGTGAAHPEVVALRVQPDQECHADLRHVGQQRGVPRRGALGPRGQITATGIAAGIAESHGYDRDVAVVVEDLWRHVEPVPQALTAGVIPRDSGGVHAGAGRLADDQDSGGGARTEDGARPERQMRFAQAAGAHLGGEGVECTLL